MNLLAKRIEKTDRMLRTLSVVTSLLLVLLAVLTFVQVLRVNTMLESQVKDHRSQTEQTIKRIDEDYDKLIAENRKSHEEQYAFIKCILLIAQENRSQASIDGCLESARVESENTDSEGVSSTSNSTPTTQPPSVSNDTQSSFAPQQSTAPVAPVPEEPTQPTPEEPTPTEPPEEPNPLESILNGIRSIL